MAAKSNVTENQTKTLELPSNDPDLDSNRLAKPPAKRVQSFASLVLELSIHFFAVLLDGALVAVAATFALFIFLFVAPRDWLVKPEFSLAIATGVISAVVVIVLEKLITKRFFRN